MTQTQKDKLLDYMTAVVVGVVIGAMFAFSI
jgi:hypothetical protein